MTPAEIKALRNKHHLTQTQAAALVHVTLRVWQSWEGGEHAMHPGLAELFKLKVSPRKPVLWEHEQLDERGDPFRYYYGPFNHKPWGEPGKDHSLEFKVVKTPLYK